MLHPEVYVASICVHVNPQQAFLRTATVASVDVVRSEPLEWQLYLTMARCSDTIGMKHHALKLRLYFWWQVGVIPVSISIDFRTSTSSADGLQRLQTKGKVKMQVRKFTCASSQSDTIHASGTIDNLVQLRIQVGLEETCWILMDIGDFEHTTSFLISLWEHMNSLRQRFAAGSARHD